jgi:hypothetical protein
LKTWRKSFEVTWLAKDEPVAALDGWVRRSLARHRGLDDPRALESVAPWSVEALARSIASFGDENRWLWCVTAMSLLQELIFCAEDGGLDPAGVATDSDLRATITTLQAIRNAVVHPAFHRAKGGNEPPMLRLIGLLEADDDAEVTELALRLPDDWSYLGERPLATYALRKLNSAGQLFIERNRLGSRTTSLQ